jgi:hypothetical protein
MMESLSLKYGTSSSILARYTFKWEYELRFSPMSGLYINISTIKKSAMVRFDPQQYNETESTEFKSRSLSFHLLYQISETP